MRWKKREKPSGPDDGAMRDITKFLWLPRRIDREYRWLEVATIRQRYHAVEIKEYENEFGGVSYNIISSSWDDVEFIDHEPRKGETKYNPIKL